MSTGPAPTTFIVENLTRQCVIASRIRAANHSPERRRGLLDAKELHPDCGLWINPCEAVHTFGMRFQLDLLFLDARLRVKKIAARVHPNRISFCLTAMSVLETRAGIALASGTECGDQLAFRRRADEVS